MNILMGRKTVEVAEKSSGMLFIRRRRVVILPFHDQWRYYVRMIQYKQAQQDNIAAICESGRRLRQRLLIASEQMLKWGICRYDIWSNTSCWLPQKIQKIQCIELRLIFWRQICNYRWKEGNDVDYTIIKSKRFITDYVYLKRNGTWSWGNDHRWNFMYQIRSFQTWQKSGARSAGNAIELKWCIKHRTCWRMHLYDITCSIIVMYSSMIPKNMKLADKSSWK